MNQPVRSIPRRTFVIGGLATLVLLPSLLPGERKDPPADDVHCHSNACFSKSIMIEETSVPLSGAATLTWWGFHVYTVGLHAAREHRTVEKVLGDVPRALTIHYHRAIEKKDIVRATEIIAKKNPRNDMEALRERLDRLYVQYQSVAKNDRYVIRYSPGKGTQIALNGTAEEWIEGEDFARAFFGLWLSEKPASESLRNRLLNGKIS